MVAEIEEDGAKQSKTEDTNEGQSTGDARVFQGSEQVGLRRRGLTAYLVDEDHVWDGHIGGNHQVKSFRL